MLLRRHHKKEVNKNEEDDFQKTVKEDLEELTVPKLKELAKASNIEGYSTMNKDDLVKAISELE